MSTWVLIIHGRVSCDPPFLSYNDFNTFMTLAFSSLFTSALHLYTVLCTLLRVCLDDAMIPGLILYYFVVSLVSYLL
jgi:hypothetical protein